MMDSKWKCDWNQPHPVLGRFLLCFMSGSWTRGSVYICVDYYGAVQASRRGSTGVRIRTSTSQMHQHVFKKRLHTNYRNCKVTVRLCFWVNVTGQVCGGSCVPGSQVLVGGWVGGVSNTPPAFLGVLEQDRTRTKGGADHHGGGRVREQQQHLCCL